MQRRMPGAEKVRTARGIDLQGIYFRNFVPVCQFGFRPFTEIGGFSTGVELHYPIDLIGKYVWLLFLSGIRRPRHVINTKAYQLQLLRTQYDGVVFL